MAKSTDSVSTTLNYDSYGRLITKNDGATFTTYGYDSNDRVNSIVHSKTSDNSALHQEWYSYDPANNLTYKIVNGVTTNYGYDNIDQLTSESVTGGLNNTYAYDHNGNRTSRISNGATDIYHYDDADKLMSVDRSSGTTNYTYDNCGRPTNIGSRTLSWDDEDRMTNYSASGVSTNYSYNGVGTRTSKSGTGGARTYKRDGVGVTASVLTDGLSSMVPGIAEKSGSTTKTILSDRLGSMKGLSSAGTVSVTADYDAFGKVLSQTGSSSTQKGFASGFGYQEDGESGYKLLGHRYYDADTGRFLSRDLSRDGRNWYSYVNNNPLKAIDADGLKKKLVILIGNVAGRGTFYLATQFVIQCLKSMYSNDYDIEIIWNATMADCDKALETADAVVYIGHGSSVLWELRNDMHDPDATYQLGDMEAALRKRKSLMDFVSCYSCESMGLFEVFSPYCKAYMGFEGDFYYELISLGPLFGYEPPEWAAGSGDMGKSRRKKKKKKVWEIDSKPLNWHPPMTMKF